MISPRSLAAGSVASPGSNLFRRETELQAFYEMHAKDSLHKVPALAAAAVNDLDAVKATLRAKYGAVPEGWDENVQRETDTLQSLQAIAHDPENSVKKQSFCQIFTALFKSTKEPEEEEEEQEERKRPKKSAAEQYEDDAFRQMLSQGIEVKKWNKKQKKNKDGSLQPKIVKRVFYSNEDQTVFAVGKGKGVGTKKVFPVHDMMDVTAQDDTKFVLHTVTGGGEDIVLEVASKRARDLLVVKLHKFCVEEHFYDPVKLTTKAPDQMKRQEEMKEEHDRLTAEFRKSLQPSQQ